MIKFVNTESFLTHEKTTIIRFKEYKIKTPTVNDWLIIQSLNLNNSDTEIDRKTLLKIVELFIVEYPKKELENLIDLELYKIAIECLEMFQSKEKKSRVEMSKEEIFEEEKLEAGSEDYDTNINFEYLVTKLCKNFSLTINDVLNMPYHHFLILIRGLDIVVAEESIRYCELTHVYLKSEKGVEAYKNIIRRYESTLKKGVKSLASDIKIKKDFEKLKSMLTNGMYKGGGRK